MVKFDYGSFEIPVTSEECSLLKQIDMFENYMPYFQESIFHYRLGKYIHDCNIDGDFVETGVYNGMSAAAIALALRDRSDSKIYLYDSWEGFPETTEEKDGKRAANELAGKIKGDLGETKVKMIKTGFNPDNIIYRVGWFKDTFNESKPEKIALLHIDCDFYDSVLSSLETFYDRVTEKGLIILDDFGAYPGCRKAFYEFCATRKICPLIRSYDHTRIFWNKTDEIESNIEKTTIMSYPWQAFIKVLREAP